MLDRSIGAALSGVVAMTATPFVPRLVDVPSDKMVDIRRWIVESIAGHEPRTANSSFETAVELLSYVFPMATRDQIVDIANEIERMEMARVHLFHVPNERRLRSCPCAPQIESTDAEGNNGCFVLPSPEPGWQLFVIASDGDGWEHISAHARKDIEHDGPISKSARTPNWREMCFLKDTFWEPEAVVVQYHPRKVDYVNNHKHTLHLWRPIDVEMPTPPTYMV